MMKRFNLLCGLILFDIVITILGVKYLGAVELNPLCNNFDIFMMVKVIVSSVILFIFYRMKDDRYMKIGMSVLIVLYGGVGISNLWHVVNYIYYYRVRIML